MGKPRTPIRLRDKREARLTQIALDPRLTLDALGLLWTLAALPKDSELDLSTEWLCAMFPHEELSTLQSAVAVLLNAGYIVADHNEYRLCLD